MRLPRKYQKPRPPAAFLIASEDARQLEEQAKTSLHEVVDSDWYREHGSPADRVTFTLCRLRRAKAGERGGSEFGDEAVRDVLAGASTEAVVWIASRAISYMDESGFPEAVEAWFPDEEPSA